MQCIILESSFKTIIIYNYIISQSNGGGSEKWHWKGSNFTKCDHLKNDKIDAVPVIPPPPCKHKGDIHKGDISGPRWKWVSKEHRLFCWQWLNERETSIMCTKMLPTTFNTVRKWKNIPSNLIALTPKIKTCNYIFFPLFKWNIQKSITCFYKSEGLWETIHMYFLQFRQTQFSYNYTIKWVN